MVHEALSTRRTSVAEPSASSATLVSADDVAALHAGCHLDPFSVLGPHRVDGKRVVRAFLPGAVAVSASVRGTTAALASLKPAGDGLFVGEVPGTAPYVLHIQWPGGIEKTEDPYSFPLLLSDFDLHLIGQGRHYELGRCLGAQAMTVDGVPGVRFAVWAPNAEHVAVVGDFNTWDSRRHPMRLRRPHGVWELFIPHVAPGARYKYHIVGRGGARLPWKADPVALFSECAPATASVVASPIAFAWSDAQWLRSRNRRSPQAAPISVYEVHAPSWRRVPEDGDRSLNWDELGERLIPYVQDLGFTHIELLPIMEHPFGGSWGYQPLGLFAPTARLGPPEAFARFINRCHEAGLGVILDWVPAHFPDDAHGLARFDGTALYEHADPKEGWHPDWHSMIYNFGRNEVRGFLIASALHWLEHFHIDGLRVDAVASMLYRDYSRKAGEWVPNVYGGRENLEAIAFFRELNTAVHERCPGALVIAEESTAWPGVSAPIERGGLGFSFKWNMGWMHDSLRYFSREPIYRRFHQDDLTFGLWYAFSEQFVLPLSHDEVVHGKGSLLSRMPGDSWQRFANLRAYFAFMWTHPGKKLLFMGSELADPNEWNHNSSVPWHLAKSPEHRGIQNLVRDLNHVYRSEPAMHSRDGTPEGFEWVIRDDTDQSVLAYVRHGSEGVPLLVIANFTPVPRHGYRVGVPRSGAWIELLNTDGAAYGGCNLGNGGCAAAQPIASHGKPASLVLTLPPLSILILKPGE